MRMIFIFIDGFGLGEEDSCKNLIYAIDTPGFDYYFNHSLVMPTETTLGVPGLPQSATGQTAIFTGVNAPEILGRHLSGQPTPTLRKLINSNNLFKELLKRGLKVTNANVYRDEYLFKMLDPKEKRYRPSVTSVMTLASGLSFRTVDDYKRGMGIYHDITGQIIGESGYETEPVTPAEAAGRLYKISREYDFTLYEHFMTDIIGHKMDTSLAVQEISLLDEFLLQLSQLVDFDEDIVLITSDHGNIEDITVKTHTMNLVPTMVMGKLPEGLKTRVEALTDIMPMILDIFDTYKGDKPQ